MSRLAYYIKFVAKDVDEVLYVQYVDDVGNLEVTPDPDERQEYLSEEALLDDLVAIFNECLVNFDKYSLTIDTTIIDEYRSDDTDVEV